MIVEMIDILKSDGWIVSDIRILQGELAFIDKFTRRLFIPMIELELHKDGFYKCVLANELFFEDRKWLKQKFIRAVPTWDLIFSHDPVTMEFIGWWDSEDEQHHKDMKEY